MKSCGCQLRVTARTSRTGAATRSSTRRTTAGVAVTGTAVCNAMQSGQLSAALAFAWTCVTWATVSSASSARHTTAMTAKERGLAWRFSRERVWNPVNKQTSDSRIHRIGCSFSKTGTVEGGFSAFAAANDGARGSSKLGDHGNLTPYAASAEVGPGMRAVGDHGGRGGGPDAGQDAGREAG